MDTDVNSHVDETVMEGIVIVTSTPRINLLTLALYMSHSGSSFGYRCIAVTAVHAVCVFVWSVLQFSVERSGTIDLSHHSKIFVRAADFAKSAHFRSSENLGRFFRQHFYP